MSETVNETVETLTDNPVTVAAIAAAAISTIAALRFRRQRNQAHQALAAAVIAHPDLLEPNPQED